MHAKAIFALFTVFIAMNRKIEQTITYIRFLHMDMYTLYMNVHYTHLYCVKQYCTKREEKQWHRKLLEEHLPSVSFTLQSMDHHLSETHLYTVH